MLPELRAPLTEEFLTSWYLCQPGPDHEEEPAPFEEAVIQENKRAMNSIREIKDLMQGGLASCRTFEELWRMQDRGSLQVGFVALLHLANEMGLALEEVGNQIVIHKAM